MNTSTEYYFGRKITIKLLKKKVKGLTYKYIKDASCVVISDKFGNWINAWGVENENETIMVFEAEHLSGGYFIVHDIALALNALFLSGDSYYDLSAKLLKKGIKKVSLGDANSMPFIKQDLSNVYLDVIVANGTYLVVSDEEEDGEVETDRLNYKKYRERKIKEAYEKDMAGLNKQLEKINRTKSDETKITFEFVETFKPSVTC